MRTRAILIGSLGLSALTALPAAAQPNPPPLAYVQPLPSAAVQTVQDRLRQAGVYTGRIDGIWGADSQASLERFQQAHQLQVTGQLNQAPAADHLLPASVRAVQARLGSLGFYSGAVDGVWGGATQVAIENFQRARGLLPDGQLGPATITAMGLAPEALAYR